MDKPNILFIFADQLRYSALGSSGNTMVQTPNLDRLAERGVIFDQAFSSCPVCSPYRGQILTGLYSHQNGVMDNEYKMKTGIATLPQVLKSAGYHTGYIGKWHLGYGPYPEEKRYGFDYMAAYNCNHDYYNISYYENEKGPIKIDGWAPEEETSLAVKFMEEHVKKDRENPFALLLSWGPPHHPYEKYPKRYQIYDPSKVDISPNVPEEMAEIARKETADYYGNVTALDDQMGRIMKVVDDLGLAGNTILCFTSDHGDHLRSHGYAKCNDKSITDNTRRASKGTPFEESIHIPFIVRWPAKIKQHHRTNVLFNSVDVMPSLLGMCEIDVPARVQGSDLSGAVFGNTGGNVPDSVYLQIMGEGWPHRGKWVGFWRGIRTDRWLYARWYNNETGPYLFDVRNDPYELNNLADDPEYAEVREEMESRLQKWMDSLHDPFDSGARDEKTGMLILGQEFSDEKWLKELHN
jgi:arylsulfatase A-like enzyme